MRKTFAALALAVGLALASPASAACNFNNFGALSVTNFATSLKACGSDDAKSAIAAAQGDAVALACLQPVATIIEAVNSQQGVAVLTAFQLFRNAKRANVIANCKAWVQTTILP